MVTVCWPAAELTDYSVLKPDETITPEKYMQQIMRCTDTTTPAASMGLQNGPNSPVRCPSTHHKTNDSKIEQTEFCLIHHIHLTAHQSTTTSSSVKKLSVGKTLPQPASGRKSFQALIKSQSMDFYAIRINKLISCWQKCINCNGSYFD